MCVCYIRSAPIPASLIKSAKNAWRVCVHWWPRVHHRVRKRNTERESERENEETRQEDIRWRDRAVTTTKARA